MKTVTLLVTLSLKYEVPDETSEQAVIDGEYGKMTQTIDCWDNNPEIESIEVKKESV